MRLIDTILKDAATDELSVNQFGHGANYYADLEAVKFPRIWIYDTFPTIKIGKYGMGSTVEYNILGGIQNKIDLDASPETGIAIFGSIQSILTSYIMRIAKDSRISDGIGDVRCEENWHMMGDNVQEISFSFKVTVDEPIVRPC